MKWTELIKDAYLNDFISEHLDKKPAELALSLSKTSMPSDYIISQVIGRQVAKQKFPNLSKNELILYPRGFSVQQSSSEATAAYKASLLKGKNAIDLTAGFGIDSMALAAKFDKLTLIEPEKELLEIVKYNFDVLNIKNCEFIHSTAEDFMENFTDKVDFIFLDPSRRTKDNKRSYQLQDADPDFGSLADQLNEQSHQFMLKAAPFLDIHSTYSKFKFFNEIHVLAAQNECKEVLYCKLGSGVHEMEITTVDLSMPSLPHFTFKVKDETELSACALSEPLTYIYEPNAAVLKSGGYKSLAHQFKLLKLANNTQLFTSDELLLNFPGRIFKTLAYGPYNQKHWRGLKGEAYRIKLRNCRLTKNEITKGLKIKEGGNDYLFVTTSEKNSTIVVKAASLPRNEDTPAD